MPAKAPGDGVRPPSFGGLGDGFVGMGLRPCVEKFLRERPDMANLDWPPRAYEEER